MKYFFVLIWTFAVLSSAAAGQPRPGAGDPASVQASVRSDLQAAINAHGGEKLTSMRTLVMKGSVDLNVFGQRTPAAFSIAIDGDKYSFEITNPFQPLKQVFDGVNTSSSIQGFALPPITSLGFPLLPRAMSEGYVVSPLPEEKRKRKGFRITTPEGFFTDFFINEKTGRLRGYESSYDVMGRVVTTSVEIDDFRTVDGVLVPSKYSQRFDLGNMTAYADFRTREILVNSKIDESVFAIGK
jgi:hypothetical protein